MGFKRGLMLVVALFLVTFVSANVYVGNSSHSIGTQYGPSEKISGWINISLVDEPATSLFRDSSGNSVELLKLLKAGSNFDYSCSPRNCTPGYTTEGNGEETMNLNLGADQKKVIGIKLNGIINRINSFTLSVSSTAGASCYSQIGIDLLNDGSTDIINRKKATSDNFCGVLLSRGCFEESHSSEQYILAKFPSKHCQKITLQPSPNFRIGAWIENDAGDSRNVTIGIYNLNMEEMQGARCNLSSITSPGNYSCEVDYYVREPTPYYICIFSDKTGTSKLRGYSKNISGCGFYQESQTHPSENAAFNIFAQGLGFAAVGEINLSDSSESLMSKIKDYIYNRYGTYDCGENGCIIPIAVNSGIIQEANLKNLNLEYTTNLGATDTKKMYTLAETPPKISASLQKLYIYSGNFTAPSQYGSGIFWLNLSGSRIFSQNISVKNFPKVLNIYPLSAPVAIPTTFVIFTNSSKNVSEYSWDFNDSTPIERTTTNIVTHTYNTSGGYFVKVTVKDSEGLNASKIFFVVATIPQEQIVSEIEKKLNTLSKVKIQISTFDSFTQKGLNSATRISELEDTLKSLQREYTFASTEEDFVRLINNISSMEVPELMAITKKVPPLPFFPLVEKINLEELKTIGGGTYSSEKGEEYKNALLGWQVGNAKIKVSMEEISTIIKNEERPILTKFVINVEKNYSDRPVYLIIKNMENMNFKENYMEKNSGGGYVYWEMDENTKEIEFTTSEILNYEELPAFVSPEIEVLSVSEKVNPFIKNLKAKWGIITVSLVVLFIAALIIYTMLSIWYKRKYENYLFKNRNDLYNLISYVNISKKKGEKEGEIQDKLKQSGWTGEQITYVLKKYSGRRTGMIELPLTKLIDRMMGSGEKPKPKPQPLGANFGVNFQSRDFPDKNGKVL